MSIRDRPTRARFRSRDRFKLAPAGRSAEAAYRAVIVAARGAPGNRSFDDARSAWAAPMDLCPDDGVYLGELRRGTASFGEITQALLECGLNASNAMDALGRLVDAGLATLET